MFTLVVGCRKSTDKPEPKKAEPKPKSSVNVMIDGVTGKTAVDAGLKAKADINNISKKRNEDLNEVLGE
jgi:hypothetical protein